MTAILHPPEKLFDHIEGISIGDVRKVEGANRLNLIIAIQDEYCHFLVLDEHGIILGVDRQAKLHLAKRSIVGYAVVPQLEVRWL